MLLQDYWSTHRRSSESLCDYIADQRAQAFGPSDPEYAVYGAFDEDMLDTPEKSVLIECALKDGYLLTWDGVVLTEKQANARRADEIELVSCPGLLKSLKKALNTAGSATLPHILDAIERIEG